MIRSSRIIAANDSSRSTSSTTVAIPAHSLAAEDGKRGSRSIETSEATGGWSAPFVASRTAEGRNAGQFSITFAWGSISGTYDTATP